MDKPQVVTTKSVVVYMSASWVKEKLGLDQGCSLELDKDGNGTVTRMIARVTTTTKDDVIR
jgi:hypothetical protein